ncbi:ATP-binding cassette domain-containing protein [Methanofollis aquaemaris]|uniref:ATP-binding cassette domain-containing protein n=1 Tax=Methanofollis aquaemaris TaxID=126734 RepID=A0A8A3S3C1_9EURY|nr:ATP-binding cassette domain-containing protein [Methanofollis aquaemaris]QSZ66369.1 ATP-binding cassette domain-containing protein [Methanofollis aquaemaris]
MTALAIDVRELTRTFGDFVAVDAISFAIRKGEIFGLLGPNGAGKTTTISMLATMLRPTSGRATVDGHDILTDEDGVRRSIGIVFQDQTLDEELTAYENMDFHGRLYRIPKDLRERRIAELMDLVGLGEKMDQQVKTFSGGMKRRLEIARGLLHRPAVLFLDEPTLGLDPQTRNHLWAYIEQMNTEEGITIILTTHYMEEADRLCDRVAIIDHGRIIAMDTPENLKAAIGGDIITIDSPDAEEAYAGIDAAWPGQVERQGSTVTVRLHHAEEEITGIVNLLSAQSVGIRSISVHTPTLEDVFLHMTGRAMRDEHASGTDQMRMRHRARR